MSQAAAAAAATAPLVIGRYALFDELAAGGMATVHLGRLLGPVGFGRTVAVKRLHSHYLKDQEFITMFMDEARIVARIRHPNVVPMVDVVQGEHGLFLVMEYVHGESLSRLMRTARKAAEPIPPKIVSAIMCGVLLGLHAAHDTKGPDGKLLGVVHRDVSPQNVIVGADGAARVLDFGIAKAAGRAQVTREGQIKGKLAYMAPEQIRGQVDRRTDVFAASVVLWELLANRRLHDGAKDVDIVTRVVQGNFAKPSQFVPTLDPEIDAIVLRGLATDPKTRFASARELAIELEKKIGLASPSEVSEWVERLAPDVLQARANLVSAMELASNGLIAIDSHPPPASVLSSTDASDPTGADSIPVDFDHHQGNGADVPSSSAVFAHTQTNPDDRGAAPPPRQVAKLAWVIVGISCLMALIGLSLGTYALLHRSTGDRAQQPLGVPSSGPLTNPRVTSPAPGSSTGLDPAPQTTPSAAVPTAKPSGAPTSATARAAASTGTGASAGTGTGTGTGTTANTGATEPDEARPAGTTTGAAGTTTTPASTATPTSAATARAPAVLAPPTAKKPGAKPACDPPYTVDDVGHRHYKPECMGLE